MPAPAFSMRSRPLAAPAAVDNVVDHNDPPEVEMGGGVQVEEDLSWSLDKLKVELDYSPTEVLEAYLSSEDTKQVCSPDSLQRDLQDIRLDPLYCAIFCNILMLTDLEPMPLLPSGTACV